MKMGVYLPPYGVFASEKVQLPERGVLTNQVSQPIGKLPLYHPAERSSGTGEFENKHTKHDFDFR